MKNKIRKTFNNTNKENFYIDSIGSISHYVSDEYIRWLEDHLIGFDRWFNDPASVPGDLLTEYLNQIKREKGREKYE